MTKNEFIEKLTSALIVDQSEETVNGLLADFNEHFEAAISAGKSEADICEMLGDPYEIAAEYKEDKSDAPAIGAGDADALPGSTGKDGEVDSIAADDAKDAVDPHINIRLYNLNLSCEPYDGDEFQVEIRQNGRVIQDDSIQVEQSRDSLRITQLRERDFISVLFRVFTFSETIFVRVPRRFSGDMYVKMTSGNADVEGLNFSGELLCELTSGNVNMERVRAARGMTVSSRSGNIAIENCDGDLSVECSSGNINVRAHKGNVLQASAISGTIRVGAVHIVKDCAVEVKSGSVHIDLEKLESNLNLDCFSGSIKFKVRELRGNITGKTRSGSITGALDRNTRALFMLQSSAIHNSFTNAAAPENGMPVVSLSARSGSIRINEL